jgi:hypothetical protein
VIPGAGSGSPKQVRGKITKRAIDNLAANNAAELVLWDSEIKGFGVRVRSGGTKTYILHYRAAPDVARSCANSQSAGMGRHGRRRLRESRPSDLQVWQQRVSILRERG